MKVSDMSYSNKRQMGFTLIELLVVIAIISIIAAILFLVFATAREKARQSTCASNLKQLGVGFQEYSQDYDETFPTTGPPWSGWAGPLCSYVKSAAVFNCPDDETTQQTRVVNGVSYLLKPVSYAYNESISVPVGTGMGIGGSLSQLTSPSKTVLLYEVTARLNASVSNPCSFNVADLSSPSESGGASNGTGFCFSPIGDGIFATNYGNLQYLEQAGDYSGGALQSFWFTSTFFAGPYGRHSKGSNYLLCDGHVKWLPRDFVSTGNYYNWLYVPSITITTPTTPEDEFAGTSPQAAGTAAPGWTVTFSPV